MAFTRVGQARLLVLILAFVASLAAVNLSFNLRSFPGFDPVGGGEGPPLIFPAFRLSTELAVAVTIGLSLSTVGLLVAFFWYRQKGLRFSFAELLPIVMILVLFFAFWFLVVPVLDAPEEEEAAAEGEEEPPAEEEPAPGGFAEFLTDRLLTLSPALVGLGIVFLAIVGSYALMTVLQRRRLRSLSEYFASEQGEAREHAKEVVEAGLYRLELGEDIRSVILGCYSGLVSLLESLGLRAERHLTAREVESAAKERLGLSAGASTALREVFELARYSSHALTEAHREGAQDNLNRLRQELGG